MFVRTCSSSRVKKRAFIKKVISRSFCWFPPAILVHQNGAPIWRLNAKLYTAVYKGACNVSANNSETVDHKDLRLEQIVYKLVFCNISFSRLLPLDGFQFVAWQWSIGGFLGKAIWLTSSRSFTEALISCFLDKWNDAHSCDWRHWYT